MRYSVSVKFGPDRLIIVEGNAIAVSISSAPERGKANAELIKKLARHFRVKPSSVRILRGLTSRNKIVEISERP
jgi:uncharacterized protein (TIGR00251 family)